MMEIIAQGVEKSYGATRALAGLSMRLRSGEIVGIAGPNGAGKSTLTRMLAGEEKPDRGEISLVRNGTVVGECWQHVAVVHQEPHVWPNMTVAENLSVGRESGWLGKVRPPARSEAVLSRLGILQYADYQLGDLSLAIRQRVEIARAMLSGADVFLFDEPNSALTDEESEALFATMSELINDGRIVLLITHRLNDFVRCCGRVMILRDGLIACELEGAEVTENAIARELTAHTATASQDGARARFAEPPPSNARTVLDIRGWTDDGGAFRDVSLELAAGSITVLSGVEGSGARELAQAIGGYRKLRNKDRVAGSGLGVTYLAANRRDTVFPNMSVAENLISRRGWQELCRPVPFLKPGRMERAAAHGIKRYGVKTGSPDHPITSLSGGNQQKVVLGAAMEQDTEILVVEEPTRGVDISSSRDIYLLIAEYAASGKAVVLYCTEVQETFQIATTVVVLSRGRIAGRVPLDEVGSVVDLAQVLAGYEAGTCALVADVTRRSVK